MKVTLYILLIALSLGKSYAQELSKGEIYERGKAHLKNNEFVDALKYLFAYKCMTEQELKVLNPGFLVTLNQNIQQCEKEVKRRMSPTSNLREVLISSLNVKSLTLDDLKEFSTDEQKMIIETEIIKLTKEKEKLTSEN